MARPERFSGLAPLAPSGSPCGRSTAPLRGAVVELPASWFVASRKPLSSLLARFYFLIISDLRNHRCCPKTRVSPSGRPADSIRRCRFVSKTSSRCYRETSPRGWNDAPRHDPASPDRTPHRARPDPKETDFLADPPEGHWRGLAASDFFTVEVWRLKGLLTFYVLFVIDLPTRRVTICGMTTHPDESWMLQMSRNLLGPEFGFLRDKKHLIVDRDMKFSAKFRSALERGIG